MSAPARELVVRSRRGPSLPAWGHAVDAGQTLALDESLARWRRDLRAGIEISSVSATSAGFILFDVHHPDHVPIARRQLSMKASARSARSRAMASSSIPSTQAANSGEAWWPSPWNRGR